MIGGSVREEKYDKLIERMKEMNMYHADKDGQDNENPLKWYTDLRRYGTYVDCELLIF